MAAALFKAASASALLNAFLSAMQIAIGLMAHSDGLFADGVHTLSDLAADGVVLIVLYLTTRHQRTKLRDAGHSADTGMSGGTAMHIGALAVSGFVMLAKEALFRYMRAEGARTGSAILLASAWHARVDAVSALVATLGLAGSLAGMPMLDHIAGAAIGLMIMRMGYASGRGALKQLFAGAPGNAPAGQPVE
jgi:divalent metal cation (Fe/Co/Zn/Cd) transporter